jgi:sugar/nucleoside kinase (ribokinase family)
VAFIGAVGEDAAGERVVSALHAEGVNASLVRTVSGRTSESVILVDSSAGTRSILHAPGVALDRIPAEAATAMAEAAWVHVDHAGWPLAREVPPDRLSVDAGNPIANLELSGLGLYAPTAQALRARYPGLGLGASVRAALSDGARRVAVTLGSGGAIGADASGAWHAAPPAVTVRSTLGAGDVFHGALVARLAAGQAFSETIREATSAAALSCRALDGRGAIPTLDELHGALSDAPPLEPIVLDQVA